MFRSHGASLYRTRVVATLPWGSGHNGSGGGWRLELAIDQPKWPPARWLPGQFAMVAVPGHLWRPFFAQAVFLTDGAPGLALWGSTEGTGNRLGSLTPGSEVALLGPLGSGFAALDTLAVAGRGPEFFAVAASLPSSRRLWLGNPNEMNWPLDAYPVSCVSVEEAIARCTRMGITDCLLVGAPDLEAKVRSAGFPLIRWHRYAYVLMPCGVGACWGCVVDATERAVAAEEPSPWLGYPRACVEGPFFQLGSGGSDQVAQATTRGGNTPPWT